MTATITAILTAALGSVGAYFTWKACAANQRRTAESDVAREDAEQEAKKAEIRDAVYMNDDEKLNQIVNQLIKD